MLELTTSQSASCRRALSKYPIFCVSTNVTAASEGKSSNSWNNSSRRKHNAVGVSLGRKRKLLSSLSKSVDVVEPAKTYPSCKV
jgi:hypothetical protein